MVLSVTLQNRKLYDGSIFMDTTDVQRRIFMRRLKVLSLIMVMVLAFTFVACSEAPDQTEGTQTKAAEESGDTAALGGHSDIKVGLICTIGGLGDQSVNDQAQMGMDRIAEEFGVQIQTAEPADDSQILDMMQQFCEMGFDLIVCCAFSHEEALLQVADQYPDVNFMILDTIVDLPNVMSFTYATHEGSFLAGIAAALKTESDVIGFVGGMSIPTIQKFETGFIEGAQYINSDIQVISKYIGSDASAWNDPATAKALTLDMMTNGADVCYHAAGGSGLGMIEACVEADNWAIGVNIDQAHLAPDNVLTSMLTRGDVAIFIATETLINGGDVSGHMVLDCSNDGVGIVMNDFFTEEEKQQIEDAKQKIISGEITVTNVMEY